MLWSDKSKWIWTCPSAEADTYGEFIRHFECSDGNVTINLSADSNYALFVNGKYVYSGQYPDFPHYKIYDEIDLTDFCHPGENIAAICVWYYGESNMSYYPGKAALRFEGFIGDKRIFASDEETLSRKSKAYAEGRKKVITGQLGMSFRYDATQEDNWINGCGEGFGKSCIVEQDIPLFPRPIRRLIVGNARPAVCIKSQDNRYLFDLSEEMAGYLTLRAKSEKPQKLLICYGEHIEDGCVRRCIGSRDFSVEVIVDSGITEYTNYFRRLGLRYLEVFSDFPVDIEMIGVLPVKYPIPGKVGNPLRNSLHRRIYDVAVRTLDLCMHEHYEDCPWREQALYCMDSRNQMLCGYYAFQEYTFPRANLLLMSKDDRKDGLMSICYPTDMDLVIPSFNLYYFVQVLEYMRYSGDDGLGTEVYDKLTSLLHAFTCRMEDGLVPVFQGKNYWNFYEWSEGMDGNEHWENSDGGELARVGIRFDAALNCLLSIALRCYGEISRRIGIPEDLEKDIDAFNRRIYAVFYDRERGLFINSTCDRRASELTNALAILCGAVRGAEAERICEILASDNALTPATLSMVCFKYDALLSVNKGRYKDFIIGHLEKVYSTMLNSGATSFWETEKGQADFDNAGSLCHGWSAMPIYYFHKLMD